MAEQISELIVGRQDGTRQDVEGLLEDFGEQVNDTRKLGQAMETADLLLDGGLTRTAAAYVRSIIQDPSRLEARSRCVCGGSGWRFTDWNTAAPCNHCNPAKGRRQQRQAQRHYHLGQRNHLDHEIPADECDVCRQIEDVTQANDDPDTWR